MWQGGQPENYFPIRIYMPQSTLDALDAHNGDRCATFIDVEAIQCLDDAICTLNDVCGEVLYEYTDVPTMAHTAIGVNSEEEWWRKDPRKITLTAC